MKNSSIHHKLKVALFDMNTINEDDINTFKDLIVTADGSDVVLVSAHNIQWAYKHWLYDSDRCLKTSWKDGKNGVCICPTLFN